MIKKIALFFVLALSASVRADSPKDKDWEEFKDGYMGFAISFPIAWKSDIHGGSTYFRPPKSSRGVAVLGDYSWEDFPGGQASCNKATLPGVAVYDCPSIEKLACDRVYFIPQAHLIIGDEIQSPTSKKMVGSFRLFKEDTAQPSAPADAISERR